MDKQYKMLTREEAVAMRKLGAPVEMAWVLTIYDKPPEQWHSHVRDSTLASVEEDFVDYFRVEVE